MLYFAYGSNMSSPRLRARVPSAQPLGVASTRGRQLVFRKIGRDGSAKCDIAAADERTHGVYGVVFRIDPAHRPALDAAEGVGQGYEPIDLDLVSESGRHISAFAYQATQVDEKLKPYAWYVQHVVRGAIEHGLPPDYIALIHAVAVRSDPDRERHARELSIYPPSGNFNP